MKYSRLLKQAFASYGVDIGISSSSLMESISTLSDIDTDMLISIRINGWLENTCPQYADYYMRVPWISLDDLEQTYRSDFPLDAMFLKFGDAICNNVSDSVEEELMYMSSAYPSAFSGSRDDVSNSLEFSKYKKKNILID